MSHLSPDEAARMQREMTAALDAHPVGSVHPIASAPGAAGDGFEPSTHPITPAAAASKVTVTLPDGQAFDVPVTEAGAEQLAAQAGAEDAEAALGELARDLVRDAGALGTLVILLMPDGRILAAALGAPGLPAECIKAMHGACMRIGTGEEPPAPARKLPCTACLGAKTLQGLPCLGCGGSGVRS